MMGSGWKGRGEAWGVGDGDGVRRGGGVERGAWGEKGGMGWKGGGMGWKGGPGGLQRDEVEQWEWDDGREMGGSNGNGVKREEWGSLMGWDVGR